MHYKDIDIINYKEADIYTLKDFDIYSVQLYKYKLIPCFLVYLGT